MKTLFQWLSQPKVHLWLLLAAALLVRLYRIDNPVADWHAFRQADTASVTREFVKHGVDLLRPRYHDLSNIQSGHDNPEGYRMVEFPLINGLIASTIRLLPFLPLVLISRLVSVAASMGTLVFLVKFTRAITGDKQAGWLAGWFFALLPFSVYYSRAILPEPFLLFFSTGSLYFLTQALNTKQPVRSKAWWFSAVFLSIALLLKPFAAFLAPLYAALIWRSGAAKRWSPWWVLYALLATAPLLLWRYWITAFPTGVPAADWLLNGNGIRLRPAWFRWLFWERLTKLILGYALTLVAASAPWWNNKKWGKGKAELFAWWAGLLTYLVVVASGNVQHDYYQVLLVPPICFTLALGTLTLWRKARGKRWAQGLILVLCASGLLLSWRQVAGYFNVNHWEYVEAGRAVDQLTPLGAKVIAPAFGDTHFLFQTNRTGWPIGFEIDDKISKGAQYYITTSYDDEARELEARFTTVEKTERYLLLDLTHSSTQEPQGKTQ